MDTVLVIANATVPPEFLQQFQSQLQSELSEHKVVVRSWGVFRQWLFRVVPLWRAPDAIVHVQGLGENDIWVRGSDVLVIEPDNTGEEIRFRWRMLSAEDQESLAAFLRRSAEPVSSWMSELWQLVRGWLDHLRSRDVVVINHTMLLSTRVSKPFDLPELISLIKAQAETSREVVLAKGRPGWVRRWVDPAAFSRLTEEWLEERWDDEFEVIGFSDESLIESASEPRSDAIHFAFHAVSQPSYKLAWVYAGVYLGALILGIASGSLSFDLMSGATAVCVFLNIGRGIAEAVR